MVGYSGTPLAKKLGINQDTRVLALNAPNEFEAWLAPLPEAVTLGSRIRTADVAVAFCRNSRELERLLPRAMKAIGPDATVWIGWPKKASGIESDLQTREVMMGIMLPTGLVDVKVGAISEVWSGLKFVVRKELRSGWPPAGTAKH